MNSKEIKKISDKKDNINKKISILKSLIDEYEDKKNDLINNCNHDYVILYANFLNKVYNNIKYGKCLVCGKVMEMNDNIDISTNMEINRDNIIDITEGETILFVKGESYNFNEEFYKEIINEFQKIINSENIYTHEEILKELRKFVVIKKLEKKIERR